MQHRPSTMSDPKQTAKGFVIASEWAGDPLEQRLTLGRVGRIITPFHFSPPFDATQNHSFTKKLGNFLTLCISHVLISRGKWVRGTLADFIHVWTLKLLHQSWPCVRGWLSRTPKRTECRRQRKRINKWTMATGALPLPSFKIKESQGLIGSSAAYPWKLVEAVLAKNRFEFPQHS